MISRLLKILGLFCRICLFYRALLQKRPIILRRLLIVATTYWIPHGYLTVIPHPQLLKTSQLSHSYCLPHSYTSQLLNTSRYLTVTPHSCWIPHTQSHSQATGHFYKRVLQNWGSFPQCHRIDMVKLLNTSHSKSFPSNGSSLCGLIPSLLSDSSTGTCVQYIF